MTVTILAEGIDKFGDLLDRLPEATTRAARIAINDVAEGEGRKALIRQMQEEVAFPAGYIDDKRLELVQRATDANPEAVIRGRQRPTSLARFASGASLGQRNASISVRVNPSASRSLPRAFLVRLRAGRQITEDSFNVGLAIRVPKGQTVTGRRIQRSPIFPDVYLLYGPSVDQVFRGVAADQSENIARMVSDEFFRQFDRALEDGLN